MAFMFSYFDLILSYVVLFLHKEKEREFEKLFIWGFCVKGVFRAGPQGEVCDSNIRQHTEL